MKSFGWALIHDDWYPHKRGKFGHQDIHTQRDDCVTRQRHREDST